MDVSMDVVVDLAVKVAAPIIAATILGISGLPKKAVRAIAAFLSARKLAHVLRQGPFDSGTISRSVQFYVRPMCSASDPSVEQEPVQALITPRESLFLVLDRFLKDSPERRRHLLLLADSGMGKTSFLVNYFAQRGRKWFWESRKIHLISLAQPDCDQLIDSIPSADRRAVDLFLDALDEDQNAIGRVKDRVADLVRKCSGFRSVVITCRTQFFSSDDDIPVETAILKVGPVPANESKAYCFRRLYLSPFDEKQINEYLFKRYPGVLNLHRRSEARALVNKIPALSVRPMLLAHLPDILGSGKAISQPVDVYEAMVEAWLVREKFWIAPESLRKFSARLAVDLFFNRVKRGYEAAKPDEIQALAIAWGVDLDPVHLTGRSLLNRTGDGRCKFAHRSIMEFFVADYLIDGEVDGVVEISDQIAQFITQRLGCWDHETGRLFAYSRISLEHVEPEQKAGHSVDHNLYSSAGDEINVSRLMSVKARLVGTHLYDVPLSLALVHCAEVATQRGLGEFLEIVLKVRQVVDGTYTCFCTQWHASAALLMMIELDGRQFAAAFEGRVASPPLENDIVLKGRSSSNGLDRWMVQRRVVLPDAFVHDGVIPRALFSNPAVAFDRGESDAVVVRLFKSYLNCSGSLTDYGILDEVKAADIGGGMRLLPPASRPGYRWWTADRPSNAIA